MARSLFATIAPANTEVRTIRILECDAGQNFWSVSYSVSDPLPYDPDMLFPSPSPNNIIQAKRNFQRAALPGVVVMDCVVEKIYSYHQWESYWNVKYRINSELAFRHKVKQLAKDPGTIPEPTKKQLNRLNRAMATLLTVCKTTHRIICTGLTRRNLHTTNRMYQRAIRIWRQDDSVGRELKLLEGLTQTANVTRTKIYPRKSNINEQQLVHTNIPRTEPEHIDIQQIEQFWQNIAHQNTGIKTRQATMSKTEIRMRLKVLTSPELLRETFVHRARLQNQQVTETQLDIMVSNHMVRSNKLLYPRRHAQLIRHIVTRQPVPTKQEIKKRRTRYLRGAAKQMKIDQPPANYN